MNTQHGTGTLPAQRHREAEGGGGGGEGGEQTCRHGVGGRTHADGTQADNCNGRARVQTGAEVASAASSCTILADQSGQEGGPVTRIMPAGLHETKKKAGSCNRTVAPRFDICATSE